jgi:predicted RNA-binding protein with TRAM domain
VSDNGCNPIPLSQQFYAQSCLINMTVIRSITSLQVDQLIRGRVRARNFRGWSSWSEINTFGATIETEPLVMGVLSYNSDLSSNTALYLTWSEPSLGPNTGGSALSLIGYNVYSDLGIEAAWTGLNLTTGSARLVDTPPLVGGQTYKFRIVAVNKYGEGPLTTAPTFTVVTGQVPNTPSAPITSLPTADSIYV